MKQKKWNIIGVIVVAVLIIQSNMFVIAADSTTDLKNQQSQNNEKMKQTEKELEGIKDQKSETMKQVESLVSQISQYQGQIEQLDNQIGDLNAKIQEQENNLTKAKEDYDKQEELLEKRLVASYEAGETSYLDFLLSSEGITELISNYYLVTEVATTDAELLENIQKQKQEIEHAKQTLETNKQELATSKNNKQSVANQLKDAKKQKDARAAQLSEQEKQTQAELEQLQADNDKIAKELKAAEEKYKAQIEALKKKQQQQNNNSSNNNNKGNGSNTGGESYQGGGTGFLQRPVKTGSYSTLMYYSSGKYHGALDYAVPIGTTVYAAADGVILNTSYAPGSYGNYITIQHTNGLRTYYAHGNGTFYVSAGQTVEKGKPIMQSGNSGNSSGPHLHFEVRVSPYSWYSNGNDSRRDPRNYM